MESTIRGAGLGPGVVPAEQPPADPGIGRNRLRTALGRRTPRRFPPAGPRCHTLRRPACWIQSAPSSARGIIIATGREPFGRPAMPIDIAAPAYHWSALKITRLIFFFAGLARDSDFLALVVDLEVLVFCIFAPTTPCPRSPILAGVTSRSQGHRKKAQPATAPG